MAKTASAKSHLEEITAKTRSSELASLQRRLQEAEDTLRAITSGDVDALVVSSPRGDQVFTLNAADRPYRQLVEQMAEGALTLNTQGMILFCNNHFARLLGVDLEQIMATRLSHWIVEDDVARYQRLLSQARKGTGKGEIRLALANGQCLPVHLSLSLLQTDEGPKLTGVVLDLSERKRAAQDLQEAWRAVRQLNQDLEQRVADRTAQLEETSRRVTETLESITDAFYAVDADWRLTYVNRRTEELWNRRREDLLGTVLWELFPDQEETVGYREHLRAMRERQPTHWENPSPNYGRWFDVNACPTADGGLAVYLHDITQRKQAEEALRRRTEELQAIMEAVPTAVFVSRDPGSRTITGNRAARELVELPPGANISKSAPEEERPTTWQELHNGVRIAPQDLPMQQAARGLEVRDYELDLVFQDGTVKSVLASATPLRDENGNPQGGITVLADVTRLKHVEGSLWKALHKIQILNRELEQRAVQLEIANKELESFSYSVSHDLRTPLISIQDFAKWLQDEYGATLPEEAQRYIQLIRTGTREMDQLIKSLLELSHLSRQELKRQNVNMRSLVQDCLQQQARGPHLTIDLRDLPEAEADPVLLKQVWANLIANACKFTRKCEHPQIEIGCAPCDGEQHVYYVRDNGVGFDMGQAERLFGVFQRLHGDAEYEGTGVGLAIVQRIIQRHGGRVWAEGRVGEGATFYFTLARAPE